MGPVGAYCGDGRRPVVRARWPTAVGRHPPGDTRRMQGQLAARLSHNEVGIRGHAVAHGSGALAQDICWWEEAGPHGDDDMKRMDQEAGGGGRGESPGRSSAA